MEIRNIKESDVDALRQFVNSCEFLTPHTAISYWILARHFADTCFVLIDKGGICGFVSAVTGPSNSDVLTLWQIGISTAHRGKGLATRLIDAVFARARILGLRTVQVIIEPENQNSLEVFKGYCQKKQIEISQVGKADYTDSLTGSTEFDYIYDMPISDRQPEISPDG